MPRPRVYDDDLRRTLVEFTARRLADGGEAAVSLRELSRAAGTSTSAVYALFGSRPALVREVRAHAFDVFAAALAAAPRTGEPGPDLLALGIAYRENAVAQPHLYRVMFAGNDSVEQGSATAKGGQPGTEPWSAEDGEERGHRTLAEPTFGVLRDATARLVGPDRAVESALRLWALAHGLVSLELAGQLPGDPERRSQRYLDALQALGPALTS